MSKTSKKYRVGLVIGRFQPFHKGHKFLIFEALKLSDKITIGIGSSNKSGEKGVVSQAAIFRKILFIKVFHNLIFMELPSIKAFLT